MLGQMSLDENQVVQSDLQGRVTGTRSAERLLDEGAQGKHTTSRSSLATTLGLRELPDNLDHLSSRIDEAVHEVDLSFALPYQLRRTSLADCSRRASRMLALLYWGQELCTQGRQPLLSSLAACRGLILGIGADPGDWLERGQASKIGLRSACMDTPFL
jgi:hypothetical protein